MMRREAELVQVPRRKARHSATAHATHGVRAHLSVPCCLGRPVQARDASQGGSTGAEQAPASSRTELHHLEPWRVDGEGLAGIWLSEFALVGSPAEAAWSCYLQMAVGATTGSSTFVRVAGLNRFGVLTAPIAPDTDGVRGRRR